MNIQALMQQAQSMQKKVEANVESAKKELATRKPARKELAGRRPAKKHLATILAVPK